jgi:hypothetical protein
MVDVEFHVYRIYENPPDKKLDEAHHKMRKDAVIKLIGDNHLDVKRDEGWDKLSGDVPHEYANLIVSLGSADDFMVVVSAFKILMNRKEIDTITVPLGGKEIEAERITAQDLEKLGF